VLFTDRRDPDLSHGAHQATLIRHVSTALQYAGIKVPGQKLDDLATHFERNTHLSCGWGRSDLVDRPSLLIYIAHDPGIPDVSRLYLHTNATGMPASHCEYIGQLPSPTEAHGMLASFQLCRARGAGRQAPR
jgi:hypothetical protein